MILCEKLQKNYGSFSDEVDKKKIYEWLHQRFSLACGMRRYRVNREDVEKLQDLFNEDLLMSFGKSKWRISAPLLDKVDSDPAWKEAGETRSVRYNVVLK